MLPYIHGTASQACGWPGSRRSNGGRSRASLDRRPNRVLGPLGEALEPLLQGIQVMALMRSKSAQPLSASLESVDSPEGRRRVADHLKSLSFPHYEPAPGRPGLLVRTEKGRHSHGGPLHQSSVHVLRLKDIPELDRRPIIVAVAGPNGAGKTTFYHAHIAPAALGYVSADVLARELEMDAYAAAKAADSIRRALLERRESFAFETVFSDPAGDKLSFLKEAVAAGYTVVLCFIGLEDAVLSEERVAMRVSQGGHDVPTEKLKSRFPADPEESEGRHRRSPAWSMSSITAT